MAVQRLHAFTLVVAMTAVLVLSGIGLRSSHTYAEGSSALAKLGLPELVITVTDDDIIAPGGVTAGRYLISYTNLGAEARHTRLLHVPSTLSVDELIDPGDSPDPDLPPPWFMQSTFVGFPGEILPGETHYAVVDLEPGLYMISDDFFELFFVLPAPPEGDASPAAEITPLADQTVETTDFAFTAPDTVSAGTQVWALHNAGTEAHEMQLLKASGPITLDDVSNLTEDQLVAVGGIGWLSPGGTAWTEFTLEPGTYVMFCWVPMADFMSVHADAGMIQIITVV